MQLRAKLTRLFRERLAALFEKFGWTIVQTKSLNEFESSYIECRKMTGARYWKRHYITRF